MSFSVHEEIRIEHRDIKIKMINKRSKMLVTKTSRARLMQLTPLIYLAAGLLLSLQPLESIASIRGRRQRQPENVVAEMHVVCHNDAIQLKVNTNQPFNGMLYAKDAPSGSGCVSEFHQATNMSFRLPLKACGTVAAEVDDGIEFFNTVVVQPHMRLMTNQGKGYHIRCKYQTRERTIANTHFNVSASFLMQNNQLSALTTPPLLATASMPSCTMKIFRSGRDDVAEAVKIGDKLIMVIEIDQQDIYGMRVSNCVVRDGSNKAEQLLINELGCPTDDLVMPQFEYSNHQTRAAVSFPAHKFPHTSSVYYQCNVRLCINTNGSCELPECPASGSSGSTNSSSSSPPTTATASSTTSTTSIPDSNSSSGTSSVDRHKDADLTTGSSIMSRRKRFVSQQQQQQQQQQNPLAQVTLDSIESLPVIPEPSALTANPTAFNSTATDQMISFDVYSGLYVSDFDLDESGSSDINGQQVSPGHRNMGMPTSGRFWANSPKITNSMVCMSAAKASVAVLAICLASMGLALMIVCQMGFLAAGRPQNRENRHLSTAAPISAGSMSSSSSSLSSVCLADDMPRLQRAMLSSHCRPHRQRM